MINAPASFDVASRVKRPLPDRAILWPTAIGHGDLASNSDSSRFPSITAIKARHGAAIAEPLAAFISAIGEAQDRIMVLDDFLFKPREGRALQPRIDQILNWFPVDLKANEVRLLTASIENESLESEIKKQFKERADRINRANAYPSGLTIKISFTLSKKFPYVHDRFAIIDDELWHFGATVGGLHEQVNAATRGWLVYDHDAVPFFDLAWDGDSDLEAREKKRTKRR